MHWSTIALGRDIGFSESRLTNVTYGARSENNQREVAATEFAPTPLNDGNVFAYSATSKVRVLLLRGLQSRLFYAVQICSVCKNASGSTFSAVLEEIPLASTLPRGKRKQNKTEKKDNNHLVTRRPYTRIRTITPSPPSSLSYTGSFQPPIAVYYRTISVSNPVSPEATSFQRRKARSPPTSTEARTFIGFLSMDTAALRAEVEGSSQKQFLACWKEKERGRLCSALRKGRPFLSPTRTRRRSE